MFSTLMLCGKFYIVFCATNPTDYNELAEKLALITSLYSAPA